MTARRLHRDEAPVDDDVVRRLVDAQFPGWGDRPLRRVDATGTSHAVFRLGDDLVVRMPRLAAAAQQVDRELRWLPSLGPQLPVEVPEPVGRGAPGPGFGFAWLVSRWVPGTDALDAAAYLDPTALAADVAGLVRALWQVDATAAPTAGKRGRDLAPHDATVRAGIGRLAAEGPHRIDADTAFAVWDRAVHAPAWHRPPVWVHGDLLASNLIVRDGRLAGVVDWSATGAGDPAADLMVVWDWPADARHRLRELLDVDDATWARARGWVVEQTVAFIPYYAATLPRAAAAARARLDAVLAEA